MKFIYRVDNEGIDEFLAMMKKKLRKSFVTICVFMCVILTIYGVLVTFEHHSSTLGVIITWSIIAFGYVGFFIARNIGVNKSIAKMKASLMDQLKVTYHTDSVEYEAELLEDRIVICKEDSNKEYLLSDLSYYSVGERNIYVVFKGNLVIYALKSSMEDASKFETIISNFAPKDKPSKK